MTAKGDGGGGETAVRFDPGADPVQKAGRNGGGVVTDNIQHVAIVGGGFSGAMLAARLAERGVASTLINRTDRFGLGWMVMVPGRAG